MSNQEQITIDKKDMLLKALLTQVSIYKAIDALESIGLLVEPDASKSDSVSNCLYKSLSSNSKIVYGLMGMASDSSRCEAFDKAIDDFSAKQKNISISDVEKHFFENKYAEVRYDCMDGIEPIRIDAWLTDNDSEEGRVIARIDQKTRNVEYIDCDASYDPYAQEIIRTVIELQKN